MDKRSMCIGAFAGVGICLGGAVLSGFAQSNSGSEPIAIAVSQDAWVLVIDGAGEPFAVTRDGVRAIVNHTDFDGPAKAVDVVNFRNPGEGYTYYTDKNGTTTVIYKDGRREPLEPRPDGKP